MTRDAFAFLLQAACFTVVGYGLARAVDAWRNLEISGASRWWDDED